MISNIHKYLGQHTKAAPLAVFRILFGLLMVISTIRFWANGWIEKIYIDPHFHFKYYGFEFITIPPAPYIYGLFAISGLSALGVALGYRYRLSIIVFFLSFTYIELMDKTTYLNHYYFVSLVSFIMIWLPAGQYFSLDSRKAPGNSLEYVPRWSLDVLKLMLAIVYIYAGAAKLNYDWMVRAMPLAIWLPTKFDTPLLGSLMHEKWVHYLFSWAGALYDLTIVFLLMWKRTRLPAFFMVIAFHVLTRILFPIGMFPYIMIAATLIFFSPGFHEKVLDMIGSVLRIDPGKYRSGRQPSAGSVFYNRLAPGVLAVFMLLQILFPLRSHLYPGNLFWTEQGYRFSWRVMLMEKTGYAHFRIVNGETGRRFYVQNEDFLTAFQQKQMATQPDFIVEYGKYLGNHFSSHGHENVEVYVDSYASLNGRDSQPFINPEVDLMKIKSGLHHKEYIMPLDE